MDYLISRFAPFSLGTNIAIDNFKKFQIRRFRHIPNSESLLVCLPGWGEKLGKWKNIEKFAVSKKLSFVVYEFPRGIFSDQKDTTVDLFENINSIVRKDINELRSKYSFNKCVLVCISLASSYGSLVYKDNPDINEIVLVAPGENLAKDMWYGCRTQHFRKSYEKQNINEIQLIKDWHNLAPENNFPTLGTSISMLFGKYDKVLPYKFGCQLADIYKQNNLNVAKKTLSLGHYFLISIFLLFPKYFLRLN